MDFTALIGAAVAKLDLALIVAIWGLTQALKVFDKGDKLARFYSLLPLVLGLGSGFLIAPDWKAALLTGFVHGAIAAYLNSTIKNLFGLTLPGDKKRGAK